MTVSAVAVTILTLGAACMQAKGPLTFRSGLSESRPPRSFPRRSHRNTMPVRAELQDSLRLQPWQHRSLHNAAPGPGAHKSSCSSNSPKNSLTVVSSADELRGAVNTCASNIVIQEHLDLRYNAGGRRTRSEPLRIPEGPALPALPSKVRTIRVRQPLVLGVCCVLCAHEQCQRPRADGVRAMLCCDI